MVGAIVYDLMYRVWAPWDAVGVRDDLRWLLDTRQVTLEMGDHAVDLGCGTGANAVFLAEHGFKVIGVDFSHVALDKARQRARRAGVEATCTFIQGSVTDPWVGIPAGQDLLIDFGTLDDLRPEGRRAMADLMASRCRPGGHVLFWCFHSRLEELPRFSLQGPSRVAPGLVPGEVQQLFGAAFDIETVHDRRDGQPFACFLMTRRDDRGAAAA